MKNFVRLILIFSIALSCKQKENSKIKQVNNSVENDSLIYQAIQQETNNIFDSLVAIRRDFHMYPELSGKEKITSQKIARYLSDLGMEVKTDIGGFGVVGILNGSKKGKKIAWRADIDALPTSVKANVDFKSKNEGVRHLCGHDVHTTIALGMANVLSNQKEQFPGTVYFVFQPSEENLKGAQAMIDDDLFTIIDPDEMYALHITPFPAGTIATKSQELFADYKRLSIFLKNNDNDLIDFTKNQIQNLQNVEPESRFWDMMNMGDPEIGLAGLNSIYKDYTLVSENIDSEDANGKTILTSFITTSDQKQRDLIVPHLENRFSNSAFADDLEEIKFLSETPTILNDNKLTEKTLGILSSHFGTERVIQLTGVVADGRSDDFALFQQRVPTVYFFLGGSNYEKGMISQPHSPEFVVDESCIRTGVQFFSTMIAERLIKQ